jgi:uncharacterized protein YqgV (UPF0045/DUF77 family)
MAQRSAKDMLRSLPRFAEGGEAGESLEETQKRLDAQRELFKSLEQQKSQFDAYQTAKEINRIEQERYAELQADIEKNPYKNVDRSRYLIQKGIRAPTRVTMGDKVYTVGPPSGMISSTSGGVLPEEYRIVDKDGKQRQEDIVLQRRRVAGPAPSAFALEKPEFDASGYQTALTDLEALQKQYADMLYRPTPKPASPPPPPPPAPTLVQEPVLPPQNLPPVVASVEPAARVDRGPRSIRAAQAAANLTPGVGVDLGFGYFDRLGNYIPAAKIVPIEEDMTNIPVADTVRPVESGIRGGLSPIAQMSIPAADISSVYSLRPMDPMGDLSLPENRNLMPGVGVDTSQGYYDRLGNFIAAPNLQPIGIGTTPVFSYREGGEVDAFIKRANGGSASSSGVRRLKMSGYQEGGEVNENPYVRMAREERAAQDKAFDSVNRQLSDLLKRYKEGDEGITEKDLLPFFPGYNEYDIAQMYGTTTESSVPSMSSKARSFTPEIMSNLRKYDELMQKDFDRLVKEKRLPRDVITARTLGLANGGEVTNDEFIQEMFTGTRPEDFPETSPVDKKAGELLRALTEGTRGFVGAEPIEAGSEAYRTGQALANMPAVGVVAATAKGAGKSVDQAKALMERMTPELEKFLKDSVVKERLYRGQRRAPAEEGFALTQGRGTPSFTTDTEVANVYSRQLGFGNPEYGPGSTVVPAYVQMKNPLDIRDLGEYIDLESFVDRLPNVDLDKPTVKNGFGYEDIAKMVRGIGSVASKTGAKYQIEASSPGSIFRVTEFDELADAIEELGEAGKSEKIQEMLFDTSIDAFLIGDSKNVKNALKEKGFDGVIHKDAFDVGGQYYQGDPKNLEGGTYAEYIHDSYRPFFQEKIKSAIGNVGTYDTTKKAITKAQGGEVTNDEFIQEMMTGTRPTDLPVKRQEEAVSNDNSTQEMFTGTRPSDFSETSPVDTAVSDFISSRSKLVTDPQEFFRVMGQNIEEYHGKPLREDPEKYLMEQLGPGVLGGIIKPKGGNVVTQDLMESLKSLRPSVLYEGYRPASEADKLIREQMKKEEESGRGISASTKRIFEENKPKAALDDWIQNKLGRYIRTEMGSEDDPVRKLGEEMTEKIRSAYEAGFKRIAKMKDKIAEAKAMGKNTDISEAELADEIDKVENAYRQTSKLPVDQGPYLYPRSRTGRAREKAGFSPYPISKSDAGKEWEGTADALFEVHKAGDLVKQNSPLLFDNPWIAKLDPKEIVYQPKNVDEPAMFTHTIDELENALNPTSGLPQNLLLKPEDMQQLSMDKAFRHVNKINDWRAQQRTAANLEEAQRAAVTFKEYPASPGKLKWQELKAPEYTELPPGFRLEDMDYGTAMLKDPQGNVLTYIDKITGKGSVDPLQQALSFLAKNDLERALKYEGSTMRHCVGKYCDDVFSGQTRVFSLRDSKGEPHITIETAPPRTTTETVNQFFRENPSLKRAEGLDDFQYANSPAFPWKEYDQWLKSQPEEVRQAKGKGNDKPSARYIEFGQDFIASKNWSDIQDLDNLDIVPLKPMLLKNAQDSGFNPQVLTMVRDQPYVTKEEFNRIAGLFGGMNKYAAGGEVTNDEFIQQMMTGTPMSDTTTQPGILPPEIRQAVDVPLDFANLLIRGTAAVPIGGVAGLYKGITGGKYGTQEGVKEADTEAARMMAKITGEPKTQTAKDVLQSIGDTMQKYKLDAALPQLLTLPSPGPGAASALMRSYELAETPPLGTVKLAGDKGVKPATPPTDQMGFYSPAEKAVMGLPQDKGTASQMLAQITKTQGVKPVELRATGLEDYLKGKGNEPVTKQEIQDFLTNNRVEVDEVVLGKGLSMSPEAKRLMEDAEKRMMEADQVMAPFFEQSRRQEFNRLARSLDPAINESSYSQQTEGSFLQGQEPYSMFYRIRGPLSRKIAGGDQGALEELDALNLPPDIRQAAIDFADAKTEYIKYSKQARKMEKPKFDQYNIPGGTNAREIYLTLPGVKENNLLRSETARLDELAQKRLGSSLDGLSPAEQSEYFSLIGKREKAGASFTAPGAHSVSPEADKNRLAHIFLDERKDAKGNNVLFVQELQSDWAQTGRDKGFVPKDLSAVELKAIVNTSANKPYYEVRTVDNQFVANVLDVPVAEGNEGRAVIEVQRVLQNRGIPGAVSPAPFVTNTEDWVNLALKRVIKEAVDNDIDTVAFIKGEQAADKYSLRTVVDTIEVKKATEDGMTPVFITPKGKTTPFRLLVDKKGVVKDAPTSYQNQFLGQPLSLVLGKDASEEILSGGSRVIKTEDMAFGGKGMEGFYDNILPKTAEKLLKKLGGGKVEPVQLEFGELQFGAGAGRHSTVKENYLGFKITPEMKEMVKTEGLPKFAAGGEVTDFIKRAA